MVITKACCWSISVGDVGRQHGPQVLEEGCEHGLAVVDGLGWGQGDFNTDQGAIGPLADQGVPEQVPFVPPGIGDHPSPLQKEIAGEQPPFPFAHEHGHDRDPLPAGHRNPPQADSVHFIAAAQEAGLRGVRGVAGALVFVKGDQQIDLVGAAGSGEAGTDVIVRPQGVKDFLRQIMAVGLPGADVRRKGAEFLARGGGTDMADPA